MKTNLILFLVLNFIFVSEALSHGEDKYGPNWGYIRMPGAYHTELLPVSDQEVQVRLLDINWKNPITQNSSVSLVIPSKRTTEVTCEAKKSEYFSCPLPAGFNLKKPGKLIVNSTRDGQKGAQAVYELPLKLSTPNNSHQGHH